MQRLAALLALLALLWCAPAFAAAPTIEASPSNFHTAGTATTNAVSPANTGFATSNCALLFVGYPFTTASAPRSVLTVVATGGITFTKRYAPAQFTPAGLSPAGRLGSEVWTAPLSGAYSNVNVVTVTFGDGSIAQTVDSSVIYLIGMVGVHGSCDMDSNASSSNAANAAAGALTAPTYALTESNDLIFAIANSIGTSGFPPVATTSAWSVFDHESTSAGSNYFAGLTIIDHGVTSGGSGTADIAATTYDGWQATVFAFTADAAPSGSTAHQLSASGAGQ